MFGLALRARGWGGSVREAALVPLPAIAGSEEAAPGDSGLLAREVVASAVGVAVARLGAVRLAAGLVVAVLGVGAAAVGGPLVVRARRGGEVLEARSLDQPLAPLEGAFEGGRAAENPSNELPDLLVVVPEDALDDGGDAADGEVAADEGPQAPVRERAGVCASRLAAEQERGDGRGDGAEDSESLLELALFVGLCAVGAERASGEVAQPRQVEAAARGVGEQLVEVRGGRGEGGAEKGAPLGNSPLMASPISFRSPLRAWWMYEGIAIALVRCPSASTWPFARIARRTSVLASDGARSAEKASPSAVAARAALVTALLRMASADSGPMALWSWLGSSGGRRRVPRDASSSLSLSRGAGRREPSPLAA